MTDQSQPTVDPSGVQRTQDGTIAPDNKTQNNPPPGPSPNTPPASTTKTTPEPGSTLLNDGDPKPAETTDKTPEDKDKPTVKAPEKYEDFTVPEGYKLDEAVAPKIQEMFKSMDLSQADAQKLVDFYIEQTRESQGRPYEAYKEMTDQWANDAKNHPDLRGKLGAGQEVNVRIAKMYETLGDPQLVSDFKALMDLTGAGNNAAFIRVLDKLAQKVTEGSHVTGNKPSPAGQADPARSNPPTAAAALWPNLKPASQT